MNTIMSIAERSGLTNDLILSLLRQACADMQCLSSEQFISLNFSHEQFKDPDLAAKVLVILAEGQFDPARLCVELIESSLLIDLQAAKVNIQKLHAHGIRFSIERFGTGNSSVRQLSLLPIDMIKVDRSIHSIAAEDAQADRMLKSIVALAESLGISLAADELDSAVAAKELHRRGFSFGQGSHFGRPTHMASPAEISVPA
jgi:EAL domain-containing protein (putative c-di-GMP-specific phosphodiesterase class I)